MSTAAKRVNYRQQTALRQAFEAYSFALDAFVKADFDVPEEVIAWHSRLAATSLNVLARCTVCKGSFPVVVPLQASISSPVACPSCIAELEALGRR